jgi:hypothetical protein
VNLTGSQHSVPGGGALSRQSRPVPESRMTAEPFESGWTVDDHRRQPSPRRPGPKPTTSSTATVDLRTGWPNTGRYGEPRQ